MFDFFPIRMAKDRCASNLTCELVSNGVQVSLKINFLYILNLIIQTAAATLKKNVITVNFQNTLQLAHIFAHE